MYEVFCAYDPAGCDPKWRHDQQEWNGISAEGAADAVMVSGIDQASTTCGVAFAENDAAACSMRGHRFLF